MTVADAVNVLHTYYELTNPDAGENFEYTEALRFLIEATKDPKYMTELAWHYCSTKRFDLEVKYLEMAAECGSSQAMTELGYVWYYGQNGEQDPVKAFRYFSKGAEAGSLWCKYKLADMYRFGMAVEEDIEEYRRRIRDAYEEVKKSRYLSAPYPEIAYRLADILIEEGNPGPATDLYQRAKRFMAQRLSVEPFWGHLEVMERIIRRLYGCIPFDRKHLDFYDLFFAEGSPGVYSLTWKVREYRLEFPEDDSAVFFDGKWFRSFTEFCEKAEIEGEKCTAVYDEIYVREVET